MPEEAPVMSTTRPRTALSSDAASSEPAPGIRLENACRVRTPSIARSVMSGIGAAEYAAPAAGGPPPDARPLAPTSGDGGRSADHALHLPRHVRLAGRVR